MDDVEHGRTRQEEHGDEPRASLATEDAAGHHEEGDPGDRHQRPRCLGDANRQDLGDREEPTAQWWSDGDEEIDEATHHDGGRHESTNPPGPPTGDRDA